MNESLYRYNPTNDSYFALNNTPTPPQNAEWPTMAIYQNEIYIIGGAYNNNG